MATAMTMPSPSTPAHMFPFPPERRAGLGFQVEPPISPKRTPVASGLSGDSPQRRLPSVMSLSTSSTMDSVYGAHDSDEPADFASSDAATMSRSGREYDRLGSVLSGSSDLPRECESRASWSDSGQEGATAID